MNRSLPFALRLAGGLLAAAPAGRAQETPPAAAAAAEETPAGAGAAPRPAQDTLTRKLAPLLPTDETSAFFFLDQMAVDKLDTEDNPAAGGQDWRPPRLVMSAATLGLPVRIVIRGRDIPVGPGETSGAERNLKRARDYARRNELTKALIEARDGLALAPDHTGLLGLAAVLAANQHDYDRARSYFQRYNELVPNDAFHLAGHSAVLIHLARLSEAEQILGPALEKFPDYLPLRFNRACLDVLEEKRTLDTEFWRKRSTEDLLVIQRWLVDDRTELIRIMGIEELRRLTEAMLGTGTADHLDELGQVWTEALNRRKAGDYAGAIPFFERSVKLGARAFGPRVDLADCRLVSGDVAGGNADWKGLETDFGDWAQFWLSYGQVLYRYGNYSQAALALERGQALQPEANDTLRFVLACAYAKLGDTEKARPIFNDLALRRPEDMRRWLDSDPTFEPALKKLPNYPAYMRALGIAPSGEL